MGCLQSNLHKCYSSRQVSVTTSSTDDFEENENDRLSYMLFAPTLEDLKNVLYVALNPYFEEFEIEVVSCPCLTEAPYNLAAAGLSGNTGILGMGGFKNFNPRPQTNFSYYIYNILSSCNDDAFVIGSGFAARPLMSYNGQLTMNAVVSSNFRNVINNSCIAYQHTSSGQRRLEIINDHNQIRCCLFGQFFFSGGKRGPVIKIRAKGRRSRSNIIILIQAALINLCQDQPLFGVGMVLVINGEQIHLNLLSDNFVNCTYDRKEDYDNQLIPYILNCENLIALGGVTIQKLDNIRNSYNKLILHDEESMLNTFSNDKLGNFYLDIAPEETEFIVYINIAQERFVF